MEIEHITLSIMIVGVSSVIAFAVLYLQSQRRRDELEMRRWETELETRRRELARESRQRQSDRDSKSVAESSDTPDRETSTPYGGYVFVDVPDSYKGLFHDTIKGFEEFARLKGYRVGIAIDTTPPGKVGFRFTILDQGATVSTETVRSHIDEYIAKLNESESDVFDDLPIVIDPIEHEKLKTALSMRFTMVRNNAEMHKIAADFYKHLVLEMVQFKNGGVGYLPVSSVIVNNQLEHGGSQMARDTYLADNSPGAAVGKGNTASIEGSTIIIGSTLNEKNEQVNGLSELIELVKHSELQNKDDAARYLVNAKEELIDGDPPDEGVIGQYLGKVKNIFALAEKGTEIYEKAKKVLDLFSLRDLT